MSGRGLLPCEPETARSVVVLGPDGEPVGAGVLISDKHVLTCRHVLDQRKEGSTVALILAGVDGQPQVEAAITRVGPAPTGSHMDYTTDLALLSLEGDLGLRIAEVEFAAPLTHSGKSFAAIGYPASHPFGLHATGSLRGADRTGLVQMDGATMATVTPGFSGAPVWCSQVRAFVGLVVASEDARGLAWCIPARSLARFHPELGVKFRIPVGDRPEIHDYEEDDPNIHLFGMVADNGARRLSAEVGDKRIYLRYSVTKGSPQPRGRYVTFVTYPDFEQDHEDAYELFERIEEGVAETYIRPREPFTVAAVGDAGETALTLDLGKAAAGYFRDTKRTKRRRK